MQQTLHINPMKKDRRSTNIIFIFVYILIFFVWLCFTIGASYHGNRGDNSSQYIGELLSLIYLRIEFPVTVLFSALIAFLYVYFLSRSSGTVIVHIAIWLICVWMLLSVFFTITVIPHFFQNTPTVAYFLYIFIVMYTANLVTSFYCARKVGVKLIAEVIKDSARAVISRPGISVFALATSIISHVLFCCIVINYALLDKPNYAQATVFCFGLWIVINFLTNLTKIVISGCVIDWFWEKDQHLNSLTVSRSFGRVLRFHLGTIAFASIPMLSHICSILNLMRCRISDGDFTKKYHFIIRFFSQFWVFAYVQDFALIQTAIYGYPHWTAIIAAHDLVAQNNHRINLAVSEVSMLIINIGYVLTCIPFLCLLSLLSPVYLYIYASLIPICIVFTTAVRALTVNKMIMEYTESM